MKLSYFADGMSKYFDHTIYKFGTAKLVNKHGKYYLHIPVTYEVEECNVSDICNVVGIDRGINFVVATYDSKHKYGLLVVKLLNRNVLTIPSFVRNSKCDIRHPQDED